jgi:hypothetical protein
MPSGPKRAPALKEAPVSKGTPTTAASAFWRSWLFGSLIKVRTPEKRGLSSELAGWYRFDITPPFVVGLERLLLLENPYAVCGALIG